MPAWDGSFWKKWVAPVANPDIPYGESESELAGICTQIVLELRRQYTIGFYVNATGGCRKWHTLKVHLRDTGTRRFILSYPESYFY